ncbi:hypothetical protein LINGRAHAP2_LOCUS29690 [Linum grandiflorum]
MNSSSFNRAAEQNPMNSENPIKWRFTWEAQSHAPNLKLFIFNTVSRPSSDCSNLTVHLKLSQCHVLVSWTEEVAGGGKKVSLKVPIPNVLIDSEIPVTFKALDDHIEVKVVLLLPVDHPLLSSFDSSLDSIPLEMSSDLKNLSSREGGVKLYCRMCSAQLTRSAIRKFEVMPSENWREVADNWFGGCCCSFGGVGEELVNTFADAYECEKGLCLLSSPAVTLCKDDVIGCKFRDSDANELCEPEKPVASDTGCLSELMPVSGTFHGSKKDEHQNEPVSETVNRDECCGSECHASGYGPLSKHDEATRATKFPEHQKSFLNGFLGDAFMVGSYNRSVDIGWKEFLCPQCSSLLGAYPVTNGTTTPVDNGIRLFKCSISTDLPASGSSDIFSFTLSMLKYFDILAIFHSHLHSETDLKPGKIIVGAWIMNMNKFQYANVIDRRYTVEKMFTNKLVENAKDELSYRTLVKDLVTKSPMLQVVLLNPNSWTSTGICSDAHNSAESISKLYLKPIIKVLFSSCLKGAESTARLLKEWGAKHTADEAFVVKPLIDELIDTLETSKHYLPTSFVRVENMSLSTLFR